MSKALPSIGLPSRPNGSKTIAPFETAFPLTVTFPLTIASACAPDDEPAGLDLASQPQVVRRSPAAIVPIQDDLVFMPCPFLPCPRERTRIAPGENLSGPAGRGRGSWLT